MSEESASIRKKRPANRERHSPVMKKSQIRQARISGSIIFGLMAVTLLFFIPAVADTGKATFRLSTPDDRVQLDPLRIPVTGSLWLLAAVLAFLGSLQLFRKSQSRRTVILGLSFSIFVLVIMLWATADREFSLVSMLDATVTNTTPIALGALSGILCERAGIVNIGIEGMLLSSAFSGVVLGSLYGGWIGLLGAVATGGLVALLLAVLAVHFHVDQIIIGVVINILALGLTSFLTAQVLVQRPQLNDAPIFRSQKIPLLGDIPILGPMFFDQTVIVYGTFVLVAVVTFFLFRTRWGLRTRAVGENPAVADTLGVSVVKVRYLAVLYGGMVGGFGGAWFTIGTVGRFDEGMTGGRGFIGLAAMIFGAWNPVGAFLAALVFGFFDSLRQKFGLLDTPIPTEFLAMAPYLVTIIVVAGLIGRVRPPAADGQPYQKEQ